MRSFICNKIVHVLDSFPIGGRGLKPSQFLPYIKISPTRGPCIEYQFQLPYQKNSNNSVDDLAKAVGQLDVSQFVERFQADATIQGVYHDMKIASRIKFKVCNKTILKEVLNLVCERPDSFWKSSALIGLLPHQKIVIDFSSPNIAKPFHVGHLRSTVIGNFLSRLHEALDHKVTKINYLGDWGTQFGLLKHGYDLKKVPEHELRDNGIQKLYDIYVWINKEAEKSVEILDEAKKIFSLMENGDKDSLSTWKLFRDVSINEYEKLYKRLNVSFDEYHGESMYGVENCRTILKVLEDKNLLEELPDGRIVCKLKKSSITVIKSDGTTLYLTRDIAAVIDRYEKYNFDKHYYVVGDSQHDHFKALFEILISLGFDWAKNLKHIKFGRILGMSTRKGTAVFLEDVLDEARDLMLAKQEKDRNTAVNSAHSVETADKVGISSVIVADLRNKRGRNFTFSWEDALRSGGDTGVRLQHIHCRLVQLEKNCGIKYNSNIDYDCLVEPQVINLIRAIARFDEVIYETYQLLEPFILVKYLFGLSDAISEALKILPVKFASPSVGEARLKLFIASRNTLAAGMTIIGLDPLQQM